jgi:hypothetical protein
MNIKEAHLAKHDQVIDSVTGKLTKVWPLRQQTEGQKKHDIFPQDIELEDSNGMGIKIQIIRESMHMSAGERGKMVTIASTTTEKGPDGLKANIYKPEGKDVVFKLVANQHASIKCVDAPAQGGNNHGGQEKTDTSVASHTGSDTGPRDCVEHRVKLYFDVMDVVLKELGRRNPLGSALNDPLAGFCPSDIKEITTGIVMSFKGDYNKYAPVVFADQLDQPSSHLENTRMGPPPQKQGAAPAKDPGTIIKAIIADTMAGKVNMERASAAVAKLGITWTVMYDHLFEAMNKEFTKGELDAAHDSLRAMTQTATPKMTDEEFYKTLFSDYATLHEECKAQVNADDVPM